MISAIKVTMIEKGLEGKTISYLAIRASKAVGSIENYSVCWAGGLVRCDLWFQSSWYGWGYDKENDEE